MKWPLVITCILLPHSFIFGAPDSRPRCEFPEQWRGSWFQSGAETLITINGTRMSNKGRCIDNSGDKFLMQDGKCFRCLIILEKHPNVIQYKETQYCVDADLFKACSKLEGDATLFSLFRSNAQPTSCPFKGPLEFAYAQGENPTYCQSPMSQADACTQDSRLLLRYMACADVEKTESYNVEMVCLATWKEGSTNYLVARLNGTGMEHDERRYRCFAYAKVSNNTWNLGQSGEASCNDLQSATDGAKTHKMTQKSESSRCSYPSWLVNPHSWVALDLTSSSGRQVQLLAWHNNITVLGQQETLYSCHSVVKTKHDRFHIVARVIRECTNGFICMVFHKRDDHVIEMQQSTRWTQEDYEACRPGVFDPRNATYTTFITLEPTTRQCPYLGRYDVVFVTKPPNAGSADTWPSRTADNDLSRLPSYEENVAEVKTAMVTSTPGATTRCHHANFEGLSIGCTKPEIMEFVTDCSDKALFKYSCHGTWVENDTAYLVASTEAGRYCLVYSTSTTTTTTGSTSRELTVTGHLASCPRASHHHKHEWQVNLTEYTQCEVSSASTRRSSGSALTTHVLFVLGGLLSRYFGR